MKPGEVSRQELIVTTKDGDRWVIVADDFTISLAEEYKKAGFEVRPAPELRRAG